MRGVEAPSDGIAVSHVEVARVLVACSLSMPHKRKRGGCSHWLRKNGVNINGAAARVMNFDRLGKKVLPGIFG